MEDAASEAPAPAAVAEVTRKFITCVCVASLQSLGAFSLSLSPLYGAGLTGWCDGEAVANGSAETTRGNDAATDAHSDAVETPVSGPPSSNGLDAQVALQLRAWKERASRMELLLTKKTAKIQEMEETVRLLRSLDARFCWCWHRRGGLLTGSAVTDPQETKLKRLLAMAKRSIDNSKQDVAERDQTIQRLRDEVGKWFPTWRGRGKG
jgi:hypothetical protein